tara:strand:- start:123 stop:1157 length:1035 start_codon:yes stop_codon:yes gene_type:complete
MGFVSTATTQTIYLKFTDYGKYQLATKGFSQILKSFGLSDNDVDYRRFNTGNSYIQTDDTSFIDCGGPTHAYPCSGQTIQTAPGGHGVERLSGCCFHNYPLERGATYTIGANLNAGVTAIAADTVIKETVCNLGVMKGCSVDVTNSLIVEHSISCPNENFSTLHWNYSTPTPSVCFDPGYNATTFGIVVGCECFDYNNDGTWDTLLDMTTSWMSFNMWSQGINGMPMATGGIFGDINGDGQMNCDDMAYALCCHCYKNGTLQNGTYPNDFIDNFVSGYYNQGCPSLSCTSLGFPSNCPHNIPITAPGPNPGTPIDTTPTGGGGTGGMSYGGYGLTPSGGGGGGY